MALDKLVDSTQLDTDLTSVADAIRTKGGTSAQLAFPADFVSAINDISGGGITPEVPTGYTQLKYLESSGTQIINTDFAPTLEMKLQIQAIRIGDNTGYNTFGGSKNPNVFFPVAAGPYGGAFYANFGNSGEKNITNPFPTYGTSGPPFISIDKTQAKFEAEGFTAKTLSLGATGLGTVDTNTRIGLFGRFNGSTAESKSSARIYRAKIWDNGTLVRDFVPALRDADDEIGMYDIVNNVFYTNAGTGVFTGGTY
jgi:hypothetical protein